MNPDNAKQQRDGDKTHNSRRFRHGQNRGRAAMPEPDNVVASVAVSAPTFRYVKEMVLFQYSKIFVLNSSPYSFFKHQLIVFVIQNF